MSVSYLAFLPSRVSNLFVLWVLFFQLDINSLSLRSCFTCLCFPHSIHLTLRSSWFISDYLYCILYNNSKNYITNFGKIFIDSWSQSFSTKIKWSRIRISLTILNNGHVNTKCWEQTNQQRQCSFAEHCKSFTSFYIGTCAPRYEGKPMENLSIFWHIWVMILILVKWQS